MNKTSTPFSRRQASLFLSNVPEIEDLRMRFNPVQARLIAAHVTLCREDEVDGWPELAARLQARLPIEITLGFGAPVQDGNFVFLPVITGVDQYQNLRNHLLSDGLSKPRSQKPHVTIIHPRNGTCTDAAFEEIANRIMPFKSTLSVVSMIEQIDGGPWVRFAHCGNESNILPRN